MGFNTVYRVLQEIFPQVAEVDTRLLRAVAVEHRKDADAAVEAVLNEIIPFLSERTMVTSSSNEKGIVLNSPEAVTDANTTSQSDDTLLVDSTCLDEANAWTQNGSSFYDANDGHDQVFRGDGNDELVSSEKCHESNDKVGLDMSSNAMSVALMHEAGANDEHHHHNKQGTAQSEEITSLWKYEESRPMVGFDQSSHSLSTTLEYGDVGANGRMNSSVRDVLGNSDRPAACDLDMADQGEIHQELLYMDGNILEAKNSMVQLTASPAKELTQNASESSLQLVAMPDMLTADVAQPELTDSINAASKNYISANEMLLLDGDSTLNDVITRSGHICSIALLEDIIEDARSNKKTLFSAMESVISLMREVELQEKAAEEAKEEAAGAGLDILIRVEDLKQMLRHAKEANDMHTGEVYGEKAILVTEVRELQSRVHSLSDERDKALAILDEMSQTLEVRLAEAEKLRKEAERERLEKVDTAQKAISDQELIMEKVVQESNILKQETEENSKLREFLIDRGRVVDMLQGEISVICQDVKLLKEKFDDHVPLSKSFTSSQTSCILASSSSSSKSMSPDLVPERADPSETPKTSPISSVHEQLSYGEERYKDDRKALVEDGWEFFDNREFDM
ncbi:unnamed protein product [Ilex paraguariensis]|uniref:CUE domain-containing protein n=1 Tax=Ilex paraguariensis TaxID=185542 RepID=A0ABC8S495_9AQUA